MKSYTIGFEQLGVEIGKIRNNTHTCPKCSHTRKKKHDRCMSVNLQTGHYNCHHCGEKGRVDSNEWISKQNGMIQKEEQLQITDRERQVIAQVSEKTCKPFVTRSLNDNGLSYLKSRGISKSVATRLKIAQNGQELVFNYYYKGAIVNAKYRSIADKRFRQHANAPNRVMYGIDDIADKNYVIIVEGEFDKLSFDQIGYTSCVSISQGAPNAGTKIGSKLKCLDNCIEDIDSKEKIIIAVDKDSNGHYLEEILINRLGREKCYVVSYPEGCKDANDVLVKFGEDQLKKCLKNAKQPPIKGVISLDDVRANLLHMRRHGVKKGEKTGVAPIEEYFSFRKGWWNLFSGIPNHGKTEWVLYLMMCMAWRKGWKWAVFSPEQHPAEDFYDQLIQTLVGHDTKNLNDEDYGHAMDFIEEHFFFVYYEPKDGETAINSTRNVISAIKKLVVRKGVDGFLIDPFNQLEKGSDEGKANEREDQYLSRILGMIDRLCKERNLCGNIVAHPRTIYDGQRDEHGDYKMPVIYDISGGSMWYNKSYFGTIVHRPFANSLPTDTTVQISVQKVKNRKRAGAMPGTATLKYSGGWYVGLDQRHEDSPLHGALESYKYSKITLPF
jgi:twinkle protein